VRRAAPHLPEQGTAASPTPPHNLPSPLTPLIGREHEEAAAVHLLGREDVRLLTLTGAAGIGKTRLALQVAADLLDIAPDGVFLIELAPIADAALVLATIVRTLEVHETSGKPTAALSALTAYLGTRCTLLLLDNFEQVAPAAPQIAELLRACPGLKMMVTSRVPLRVRGEHRLAVPPLALPELTALPPVEELVRYASIALFVQRAREVKPTFALTPAQAPAVAAICHRLDGLPLAIELAAAWVRLLTPTALLQRLERRLPLLTGGAGDLPERQQTLRTAIDWSYDLLALSERTLLRRLAVFVRGWTLEAAEAVGGEVDRAEEVLLGLARLVDTSLVDQQEEAADGETRFRLLELVREYALERLRASGEIDMVRERHANYFMNVGHQARVGLAGAEEEVWLSRLARENENLRAAFEWAKQHDVASGLRLAGDVLDYWDARGLISEGRQWLEDLLDLDLRAGRRTEPQVRAFALHAAGILAFRQDDLVNASAREEEVLYLARSIRQQRLTANALNLLANIARQQGDYGRAQALFEDVLMTRQTMGRELDLAMSEDEAGHLTSADLEALWREQGIGGSVNDVGDNEIVLARLTLWNKQSTARVLGALGYLAQAQGDYARAIDLIEQARACFTELGSTLRVAHAQVQLGQLAALQGDYGHSRALLEQVLPLFRNAGHNDGVARALIWLARVAREQGDRARALTLHRECLALCQQMGDRTNIAENLEGLGLVWATAGRPEVAGGLLAAAAAVREVIKVPLPLADCPTIVRAVSDVRARLGEETFEAVWAMGRATPLDQIITEAMQD